MNIFLPALTESCEVSKQSTLQLKWFRTVLVWILGKTATVPNMNHMTNVDAPDLWCLNRCNLTVQLEKVWFSSADLPKGVLTLLLQLANSVSQSPGPQERECSPLLWPREQTIPPFLLFKLHTFLRAPPYSWCRFSLPTSQEIFLTYFKHVFCIAFQSWSPHNHVCISLCLSCSPVNCLKLNWTVSSLMQRPCLLCFVAGSLTSCCQNAAMSKFPTDQ